MSRHLHAAAVIGSGWRCSMRFITVLRTQWFEHALLQFPCFSKLPWHCGKTLMQNKPSCINTCPHTTHILVSEKTCCWRPQFLGHSMGIWHIPSYLLTYFRSYELRAILCNMLVTFYLTTFYIVQGFWKFKNCFHANRFIYCCPWHSKWMSNVYWQRDIMQKRNKWAWIF